MIRTILIGFGLFMLIFGMADLSQTRPRFVGSSPEPGRSLASPPTAVTVTFSMELSPQSTISVLTTVSQEVSGDLAYSGGKKVSTTSEIDIYGPPRRSLKAILQLEPPNGIYRVDWNATAAESGAQRYGSFYFAAGMPMPDHLLREGTNSLNEKDVEYKKGGRASAIGGGILLTLLGLFWGYFPKRA